MSPAANTVETWLDHIQDSITHGDGDTAEATVLPKERLPLQAQDDGYGESRLRRAHKRDSDLMALIPDQSSADHDRDAVGELQRKQQTLVPLGNQKSQNERAGDGLNLAMSVASEDSRPAPALQCLEEEFVRKPRRKTRPDRYATKKALVSDKGQSHRRNGDDDDPSRGSRKARLRIRLRSGKEVMSNFTSENICRDTLITKPCVTQKHPDADPHTREGRDSALVLRSSSSTEANVEISISNRRLRIFIAKGCGWMAESPKWRIESSRSDIKDPKARNQGLEIPEKPKT
ncbi:hypothetical protein E4U53_007387 [Claviceps sorghi]|nr:hypothetical protein E4U53_007387 [Claviceps sorghi]